MIAPRLRPAFALAAIIGLVAAAGGYVASWFWQIPTGATMVVLAGLFVLPGAIARAR